MKNIVYLNNYIGDDVLQARKNFSVKSQAANNKIIGILRSLASCGCKVSNISSGIVNRKTGKIYRALKGSIEDNDLTYCSTIDIPLLSTIWSSISIYLEIARINKSNRIDNIIFYNFKPEVAIPAYLAKRILGIPITIEYEDGISNLPRNFRYLMLELTEKIVKPHIASAIIVNSNIKSRLEVPCIVIRGLIDPFFHQKCKIQNKICNDKFTILYSGGLDPERGINVLIAAANYLDFPCQILVTGGANIDQPKDSKIKYLGYIDYEDVQNLMLSADVLIQSQLVSSSFSLESFPSKLFEYLATGNSIVSSDLPDVRDFAQDALIYYSDDDPMQLANAIKFAYSNQKNPQNKKRIDDLCVNNLPISIGTKLLKLLN